MIFLGIFEVKNAFLSLYARKEEPSLWRTCFITAVRHNVNNLVSYFVIQELEIAINLAL